ncbi:MAG: hypothetical protein GX903_06510 [Spirochaetales bacterium]|jgi:23S rRNA (uracil1939-C5)-methyltransferase|nr:hypothetical protein [Spirochaetales bacterium]
MAPRKIVYISCNPVTQERDLDYIYRFSDYTVNFIQSVDNFPRTTLIFSLPFESGVSKEKTIKVTIVKDSFFYST